MTWVDPWSITLSKVSPSEKDKCHMSESSAQASHTDTVAEFQGLPHPPPDSVLPHALHPLSAPLDPRRRRGLAQDRRRGHPSVVRAWLREQAERTLGPWLLPVSLSVSPFVYAPLLSLLCVFLALALTPVTEPLLTARSPVLAGGGHPPKTPTISPHRGLLVGGSLQGFGEPIQSPQGTGLLNEAVGAQILAEPWVGSTGWLSCSWSHQRELQSEGPGLGVLGAPAPEGKSPHHSDCQLSGQLCVLMETHPRVHPVR